MWVLEATDLYVRRHKRYEKKHPRELGAVLENLETYVESLNAGMTVRQNVFGFVHPEPQGVKAIDQRGVVKGKLAETRLYTTPTRRAGSCTSSRWGTRIPSRTISRLARSSWPGCESEPTHTRRG